MVRKVISLDEEDARWLDERARIEGVSRSALIGRAVRLLRERETTAKPPLEELLRRTSGIWTRGDGLEWQRRLRREG